MGRPGTHGGMSQNVTKRLCSCGECEQGYQDMLAHNREYSRKRAYGRRDFLNKLKEDQPCTDCGQNYPPYIMQYDHIDPATKKHNVSTLATQNYAFETLLEEIKKCELVCANCHAERTHGGERV